MFMKRMFGPDPPIAMDTDATAVVLYDKSNMVA